MARKESALFLRGCRFRPDAAYDNSGMDSPSNITGILTMNPGFEWAFGRHSVFALCFRLEVYPVAKPKNTYFAVAPRVFNVEIEVAYWRLYFYYNRKI